MGSYILFVSICMGKSISIQRVKYFLKHRLHSISFTSPEAISKELIPHNDSILLSKSVMQSKSNVNAFKSNGKSHSYQLDNWWYFFNFIQFLMEKTVSK